MSHLTTSITHILTMLQEYVDKEHEIYIERESKRTHHGVYLFSSWYWAILVGCEKYPCASSHFKISETSQVMILDFEDPRSSPWPWQAPWRINHVFGKLSDHLIVRRFPITKKVQNLHLLNVVHGRGAILLLVWGKSAKMRHYVNSLCKYFFVFVGHSIPPHGLQNQM